MILMRRRREEGKGGTGARSKSTTPRNPRTKKKGAEERLEEAPLQRLMKNGMSKKEDKGEEDKKEKKGVMALQEKLTQKNDRLDTYDEWKKMSQEKRGKKRKADEGDMLVGQQKKLLNINIQQYGYNIINNDKINHPCSSGEGEVQDDKVIGDWMGGTVDGGVIGNVVQRPVLRVLTCSRLNRGAAADWIKPVPGKKD